MFLWNSDKLRSNNEISEIVNSDKCQVLIIANCYLVCLQHIDKLCKTTQATKKDSWIQVGLDPMLHFRLLFLFITPPPYFISITKVRSVILIYEKILLSLFVFPHPINHLPYPVSAPWKWARVLPCLSLKNKQREAKKVRYCIIGIKRWWTSFSWYFWFRGYTPGPWSQTVSSG